MAKKEFAIRLSANGFSEHSFANLRGKRVIFFLKERFVHVYICLGLEVQSYTPITLALPSCAGQTLLQTCCKALQHSTGTSSSTTLVLLQLPAVPALCCLNVSGALPALGLAASVPEACQAHNWVAQWAEMGVVT